MQKHNQTIGRQPSGLRQLSCWGSAVLLCVALAGCAHDWSPGVGSLSPGSVTSSQWEPEVDYEAERARQAE